MTCLDLAIAEMLSPYRYMAMFYFGMAFGLALPLALRLAIGRCAQE